jgi:hypothetical protein
MAPSSDQTPKRAWTRYAYNNATLFTIKLTSAAGPVMSPFPWPTKKLVCCCAHTAELASAHISALIVNNLHDMMVVTAFDLKKPQVWNVHRRVPPSSRSGGVDNRVIVFLVRECR